MNPKTPIPKWLDKPAHELWKAIVAELEARDVLQEAMPELVAQLAQLLLQFRKVSEQINDSGSAFVDNPTGYLKAQLQLADRIARYHKLLRLDADVAGESEAGDPVGQLGRWLGNAAAGRQELN